MPAASHWFQSELHLRENVLCYDINEGCSGYEQGLYLASLLVSSKQCRKVLLLVGDTISKITSPQDKATRLIFGDAGTASIISNMDCDMVFNIKSYGERNSAIVREHNGFLQMDGGGIMQFTLNDVPKNVEEILAFAGVTKDDVNLYACHQANKLILSSLADILHISSEKLPFGASQIGNTSSASIPLVLTQNKDKALNKCMLCGFGVGLACALCLTDLSRTDIKETVYYE